MVERAKDIDNGEAWRWPYDSCSVLDDGKPEGDPWLGCLWLVVGLTWPNDQIWQAEVLCLSLMGLLFKAGRPVENRCDTGPESLGIAEKRIFCKTDGKLADARRDAWTYVV